MINSEFILDGLFKVLDSHKEKKKIKIITVLKNFFLRDY